MFSGVSMPATCKHDLTQSLKTKRNETKLKTGSKAISKRPPKIHHFRQDFELLPGPRTGRSARLRGTSTTWSSKPVQSINQSFDQYISRVVVNCNPLQHMTFSLCNSHLHLVIHYVKHDNILKKNSEVFIKFSQTNNLGDFVWNEMIDLVADSLTRRLNRLASNMI